MDRTTTKRHKEARSRGKSGGFHLVLFNEKGELVIARLSPTGYAEVSRAKLLEPTGVYGARDVVWSHPAFAHRCVYARNDKELVCASLAR